MAVSAGAGVIGVNNRNLKDFSVDFSNAVKLRHLIPEEVIYVAESGVSQINDVAVLRQAGADAVLIVEGNDAGQGPEGNAEGHESRSSRC